MKKLFKTIGWLALLAWAPMLCAQIQVGENTHLNGGGLVTAGYAGDYGDDIPSSHGINAGASGSINGNYYNPNFLNFSATPYYNQSRADSNYQSLTDASGIAATANLFTGSHFPGSVSYHYDHNSTGTFGLVGLPNFTTQGNGQGVGINWSALLPGLPTLSVGFQHGSGSGTLYGTDEETSSAQNIFNVRSSYQLVGFNLHAYYDHNTLHSTFPEFLTGNGDNINNSNGYDTGIGASRGLPLWHGEFYSSFNHSLYNTDYLDGGSQNSTNSGYAADTEMAGASFRPTEKLGLFVNQNYTNNLSSYFNQSLISNNNGTYVPPLVDLGNSSYSNTVGGGASYQFTNHLIGSAQGTHYDQSYFGNNYSGTFLSGNLSYGKRILDLFTFSAGFVDSSINFENNNIGFVGTMGYYHRFGQWQTSGSFSYAQNVQSVLVTDTTSYYSYNANLHRKFSPRVQWTAAVNGSHSGFNTQQAVDNSSESFSTSLSLRWMTASANYNIGSGTSVITNNGIVQAPLIPGAIPTNAIAYDAHNYGGSLSWTPIPRLVVTGTYSRALSNTLTNGIYSRNNNQVIYSQLQYRLRRISLLAGYTRFNQGISATGIQTGAVTSYFAGISRWFDLF